VDFSALGYPSTFMCSTSEILDIYEALLSRTDACNPEIVVVEIADGLLQRETFDILSNTAFMSTVYSVLFSAGDSMGAISGMHTLNGIGIQPFAMTGLFTASPLLVKEVQHHLDVPILLLDDLSSPTILNRLGPGQRMITA
jgi:hypothetical protein